MNPSVVLAHFGAVVGVAVLLVMAVAPLFSDQHRPRSESPLKPAADTPRVIAIQRGVAAVSRPPLGR
ncbi:MAG: hypothetical protein QOI36_1799 [Pseudonocardiales bacterium]|jgi:hypothetical protein|nr:hypothetical protein [Pseudonocardia sp.]MDT7650393.1 hypothetical protein [Pseudonocardiales bacterium]